MKITTYGEHLIQLTRFGAMSCYLVREDDGFTLIDTGMPGSAEAILAAAKSAGQPIVRIVLTHAHMDHAGSLDALHTKLPETEVIVSRREARLLAGDYSMDEGEPPLKLSKSYLLCRTQPTRLVEQGEHIGSLEVIATPGHTPGHTAFLDLRDHSLIAGDAFQTLGGVAVSGSIRPLFPLPALGTWHRPTALESAHRLRAIEPALLAVGHGPLLSDPLPEMDRAIATLEQELAKREAAPDSPLS